MNNILLVLVTGEKPARMFVVPEDKLAAYPMEEMRGHDINSNISDLATKSIEEIFQRTGLEEGGTLDLDPYEYTFGRLYNVSDMYVLSWYP